MAARTAQSVSTALKRKGIVTGLRYTQMGYTLRDGSYITEPGVEITRQKQSRYGGKEDMGYVGVFPVLPHNVTAGPAMDAYVEQVGKALEDTGLPFERKGSSFRVLDED